MNFSSLSLGDSNFPPCSAAFLFSMLRVQFPGKPGVQIPCGSALIFPSSLQRILFPLSVPSSLHRSSIRIQRCGAFRVRHYQTLPFLGLPFAGFSDDFLLPPPFLISERRGTRDCSECPIVLFFFSSSSLLLVAFPLLIRCCFGLAPLSSNWRRSSHLLK